MSQITDLYRIYIILADKLHYSFDTVSKLYYYEAEYLIEEFIKYKEEEKKAQDEQSKNDEGEQYNIGKMMNDYESRIDNKFNAMKNSYKL